MAPYNLVLPAPFAAELEGIRQKYPACRAAIDVALRTIEHSAPECGISTNRGQRYIATREQLEAPSLVIFFQFDEASETATCTCVSERPRSIAMDSEE